MDLPFENFCCMLSMYKKFSNKNFYCHRKFDDIHYLPLYSFFFDVFIFYFPNYALLYSGEVLVVIE